MWERAGSRRQCGSHLIQRLIQRIREQACSHIFLLYRLLYRGLQVAAQGKQIRLQLA